MNIFRKHWVAWVITLLVAVGSVTFGVMTADADVLSVRSGKWVYDGAGVLDDATEKAVKDCNAEFDKDFNAYLAVATVDNLKGWEPDAYAAKLFEKWGLYGNDFMLLLDVGGKESYLYHGSNYADFDYSAYLDSFVNPSFEAEDYNTAVTELLPGVKTYLEQLHGTEGMDNAADADAPADAADGASSANGASSADGAASSGGASSADAAGSSDAANTSSGGSSADAGANKDKAPEKEHHTPYVAMIVAVVVLLGAAYGILLALDRSRYRSWYHRYGREEKSSVEFQPILFWHHPGGWWSKNCIKESDAHSRRSSR